MTSYVLLFLCAGAFLWFALSGRTSWILAGDIMLTVSDWKWEVSGVQIDSGDIAFACLALSLVLGTVRRSENSGRIPYLGLWIFYGVLASLAYLNAPGTQQYLTSPVAVVYQLYRYCWKASLYYLIAVKLLDEGEPRQVVILALILLADYCALVAIQQGMAGEEAMGPLGHKNDLASALLIPMILSLAEFFITESRRLRVFYFVSSAVMARGILIATSRGAFVASVVGGLVFMWGAMGLGRIRPRMARLATLAVVVLLLLFAWNPRLSSRPALARTLSATQFTDDDNLQWRMQERWPHFWAMMWQRPLLGWGTDVDPSLSETANTPHNGYLALAVKEGIPAAAVFLAFIWLAARDGLRIYRRGDSLRVRLLGLAVLSGIAATIVHNLVDVSFEDRIVLTAFWLLVGVSATEMRRLARAQRRPVVATASRAG